MARQTTCKCGHNKVTHVMKGGGCAVCKCKGYRPVNS